MQDLLKGLLPVMKFPALINSSVCFQHGFASARNHTVVQRGKLYSGAHRNFFPILHSQKPYLWEQHRAGQFMATQQQHRKCNCKRMLTSAAIDGSVAEDEVTTYDGGLHPCKDHGDVEEDGGFAEDEAMADPHMDVNSHHSWNRQVSFNVKRQQIGHAILVLNRMLQESVIPDKSTYILLLSTRSSSPLLLRFAIQVHSLLPSLEMDMQSNIILGNILISLYGRCSCLECSRIAFHNLSVRTVVSWNAMISVCVQHNQGQEALRLFNQMKQEGVMANTITFVSTLHACSSESALVFGMQLHAGMATHDSISDVFLNTALVSMYAKCACMERAESLFQAMPDRNVISWNTIISAYVRHGQGKYVVALFHQLQKVAFMPTVATFVSIISSFASHLDFFKGKWVHSLVMGELFDSNVSIGTALIGMYRRCGSVSSAQSVFDAMRKHDQGSWNAMVATYAQYSQANEALQLFMHMQLQGILPNKTTYSSILSTCSYKTALFEGMRLHALIMNTILQKDILVGNALVSMYSKCGALKNAQNVFDKMDERNTVSWNAMLDAHALHGKADSLFQLYEQMQRDQVPPDHMTFTSMLTLCSRLGLVDEARNFILSMNNNFGLAPRRDHFNCVVDLLARAGKLDEAEVLLSNMPISNCAVSMRTLLGACRSQTDVSRGERAARQVILLDPKSTSPYMILSGLYVGKDEEDANCLQKKHQQAWCV